MALRSNLRAARVGRCRPEADAHKSLRATARDLNVTPSTLSEWERDKHAPSLEDALRVAAYYRMPVEALWQLEATTTA